MTAREKFLLGAPVQMSAAGQASFPRRTTPRRGVVAGFGRAADAVRIRFGGTSQPVTYHMDYWEPCDPPPPASESSSN